MKLEVAQLINREIHTYALEALEAYAQDRIERLQHQLEMCKSEELSRLQGAISELRLLARMKADALAVLDQARNGKTSNPNIR